ncbi:phosphatidic acid phosphatase [Amycolatopsis sp. WAC 01375]|uniref:phosphatase PAP2 family protein n=1 Tax=unclassified Amycolatopsis TaxID=2618356 RepID=UPI000F796B81|nr:MULTISPECIES: phosphatase PAP2 family protein [unclassified Amycolatopsis]RSM73766.1 phosphatidic acid phosphatase [Amycolatopsis sp. WAC 01375]RSN20405.1 phosphatidic acid phosphatase [Amycolatopsis sp. WAC 01416]
MTVRRGLYTLAGTLLLIGFVTLGLYVDQRPPPVDVALADAFRGQHTQASGHVAGLVTNVLGPVLPFALGAVLAVLAWRRRDLTVLCVKLAVVLLLCRMTSLIAKPVFYRERPREFPDLSYPSGHVVAVACTGFVAVLLCAWTRPHLARLAMTIAAAATAVGALCRIVLGVHWLTDTAGSVLAVGGVGLISAAGLGLLPLPEDPA